MSIGGIGGIGGLTAAQAMTSVVAAPSTTAAGKADFVTTLNAALQNVSQSQNDATELQKQFQMENPNVSLEQTMVALNTASINFAEAVQVRNKLVQAYDQVMNMQI